MGGQRDANWSDWYAEYMAAEQSGRRVADLSYYDVVVVHWGAQGDRRID